MRNSSIHISPSPIEVAKSLAKELYFNIRERLTKSELVTIAVSGGTTPQLLFEELAANYSHKMEWRKIHFWWVDERCVHPDDEQSNYRMVYESLLNKIAIPQANIHRMKGEANPEEEAKRYADEINNFLPTNTGHPVFDIILLGMGNDGHTASIFPNQMDLLSITKTVATAKHPESGQIRITLTGTVINAASSIYFLVTGKNKAAILHSIIDNLSDAEKFPASHIIGSQGALYWYIDKDASAELINP